jgi:hypothetical protein
MTTLALPRARSFFTLSDGFGIQPNVYRKSSKRTLVVEHAAVFRSGTFRDSSGYQNEWLDIHMRQMLENFNYLRNNKIFENVPVRLGHPGFLINGTPGTGAVAGWHTALVSEKLVAPHDGVEYDYVFADFEILDGKAADDYEAGLLRNRSAEIIPYFTNNEAEFWPTYAGFAFVDIPAVEGLNFSRDTSTAQGGDAPARVIVMFDKEIPSMTTPVSGVPAPADRPALGGAPQAQAQAHVFSINGQATSDFAAVQRHITVLETQASETRTAARQAFVSNLAHHGAILAAAIPDFEAAVAKMDDETYDLFCKGYAGVGTLSAVGQHAAPAAAGAQGTQFSNGAGAVANPQAEEIEIAKQVVAGLRRNGMHGAQLKSRPSYQKLVAAGLEQA